MMAGIAQVDIHHMWSSLEGKDEGRLRKKLADAELCPYHDVLPEIIGPDRCFMPLNMTHDKPDFTYDDALQNEFSDAYLFPSINWTCFCKKCAKENPTPGKHNKFGCGFCSQYSWQASLRNWNSACMRAYKRIVKDNLDISKGTADGEA